MNKLFKTSAQRVPAWTVGTFCGGIVSELTVLVDAEY